LSWGLANYVNLPELVGQFDFRGTVLDGMLALLLFARALHVDVGRPRRPPVTIGAMATLRVVVSTAIIGGVVWVAGDLTGVPISFPWALIFGAPKNTLISPTDPVMVILWSFVVAVVLKASGTGNNVCNAAITILDEDNSALTRALTDAHGPPWFQTPVMFAPDQVKSEMGAAEIMFVLSFAVRIRD
jgi:hypothetical protein